MRAKYLIVGAIFGLLLLPESGGAEANSLRLAMDGDGGGGPYINIVVREVRVAPIRAHVGDAVRIELTIEDYGELFNATRDVWIRANGKIIANQLVTYGFEGDGGRVRKLTFLWDTRGARPGEYRIRGEAFVWEDASPFDNFLDVKEPVVLLRPGDPFPGGAAGGGEAVATDPRYRKAAVPAGGANGTTGY